MRKLSKWVLVSAAVLAVIACQRERTFTEESSKGIKEVETEFILSVATNAPQTKMASNIVQQTGSFRGIENAKLITYNMRLVAHIAKKYAGSADKDDLIRRGAQTVGSASVLEMLSNVKNGRNHLVQGLIGEHSEEED